jgi:outer membrane cobalamin receptor
VVVCRSVFIKKLVLFTVAICFAQALFCQINNPLEQRISFNTKNKNVGEILKIIRNKTKVTFNYKSGIFPNTPLEVFEADNERLADILFRLLKPFNIEYRYFGGNAIVLKPFKNKSNREFTISGYVFDKTNGEKLIGATVFCHFNKRGAITNDRGFFTLTLPEDSVSLEIRYVGYVHYTENLWNKSNAFKIINLLPNPDLKEVIIGDEREAKTEQKPNSFYFNLKAIKDIPTFMGEPDVIRAVQMLPGVHGAGESAGGINVRGGGTDQNLVLIDGVPVYNMVHVFGLFSIINPSAINSVELIKGGFSAKQNGRLSSILDIKLKDGNNQKIAGNLNIGMLLSSLTLEGPLIKNKSSFLVSFRRTYFDAVYKPVQYFTNLNATNKYGGVYYFYDLNAKINYKIGNRDKITLNYFTGTDRGKITEKQVFNDTIESLLKRNHIKNLKWFTIMGSAGWDHIVTDKVFMVTTVGITRYTTKFEDELTWETRPKPTSDQSEIKYSQSSGNSDMFLKMLLEVKKYKKHNFIVGADFIYHKFNTGTLNYSTIKNNVEQDTSIGDKDIFSFEKVVYAEDNWAISKRLNATIGLSYNSISVKNKTYNLLQPRLSVNYSFNKNLYVNASFTRMQQNLQILPNNSVGLPVDIWIPVTNYLKPQTSDQTTVGVGYYFKKHYKISLEGYFKSMNNLVELKEGAFFVFGGYEWDKSFYTGRGYARGMELMIEKNSGKLKGWIGYTLAKSDRTFSGINQGKTFPFKYDRRHQFTAFIKFPTMRNNWNFSLTWIFSTGSPVTIPTSVYNLNGKSYYEFTERNNVRMSNYHRMDVAFTKSKIKKQTRRTWNIGAYNLYSHINPIFVSTSYIATNTNSNLKFFEVGLIPLLPFISYEIAF